MVFLAFPTEGALAQNAAPVLIEKARNGDLQAQLSVAQAYQYGIGAEKNTADAIHWYEAAAQQQSLIAMYELGNLVYSGVDPEDTSEAARAAAIQSFYWFSKAAKLGFPQAQSTLGLLYGFGDRVETNTITGRMWLAVANINGITPNKTMVGMLENRMSTSEIAQAVENAGTCIASDYVECN